MAKSVARTTTSRAVGYIVVTYRVYPEDGQFVSVCEELGTSSCGDTVDEALRNIEDATKLYLNAIEAAGERDRIFRERNIPIYPVQPTQARHVRAQSRDIVSSGVLPLLTSGRAA